MRHYITITTPDGVNNIIDKLKQAINNARDGLLAYPIEITIKEGKSRSTQLTRYYFGVMVAKVLELINEGIVEFHCKGKPTKQKVHEMLTIAFAPHSEVRNGFGVKFITRQGITEMNNKEMQEYMANVNLYFIENYNIDLEHQKTEEQNKTKGD